jgi:hypothetical protein
MAAHRRSDRRRDDLHAVLLRSLHLFDLALGRFRAPRRYLDNLCFEFLLGFVLGHEFQDTFVNEVLNGPSGSICQFSEFSHHPLIEFV